MRALVRICAGGSDGCGDPVDLQSGDGRQRDDRVGHRRLDRRRGQSFRRDLLREQHAGKLLVIYGNLTDSISPTANKPQTVELTHAGQESSIHCNGPCTFISPPTSPLSDYTAPLNALSTQLSKLSTTPGAGIVDNGGNAIFTVPTGDDGHCCN
jgi:hypothetical protein